MRLMVCLILSLWLAFAQVPKTWDDKELAGWALPLVGLQERPGHFTEREYYQAPAAALLRTYPVYLPEREPAGYWESIQKRGPLPLLEPAANRTPGQWIQAGRRIFEELDVPLFRTGDPKLIASARTREGLLKGGAAARPDGSLFGLRWAPTSQGVQLSISECSGCHQRLLPDGTVLNGAPFNEVVPVVAFSLVNEGLSNFFAGDSPAMATYRQFGVPWLKPDPHETLKTMEAAEMGELFLSQIPGVFARFNGSPFYLTKIPDLIGLGDRKYIDHTATHRLREIGDVMRYAALVGCCDSLDFGPHRMLTEKQRRIPYHFPDDALYAMAQYLYSLEPPANPHRSDPRKAAGNAIFEREGCGACHTPPLYTNNKITPASGFQPPKEHFKMFDILDLSVGTDPDLALKTRKGTGYYKVPSLKGVWYRGLYLHDGSIASLEDLFDPARLHHTYLPSGFRGFRVQKRAVPGHEFGLKLKPEEKASLIAFLRKL